VYEQYLALVLDEHTGSDLVFAEDDVFTGGAKTPHAPEDLPILKCMPAAGTIVQFEVLSQVETS